MLSCLSVFINQTANMTFVTENLQNLSDFRPFQALYTKSNSSIAINDAGN